MSDIVTPPSEEPITLDEVRDHLRIDDTGQDATITGYLVAARTLAELWCRRALITQTRDLWLETWPWADRIDIPNPPLQSVTWVKYYDTASVAYTMSTDDYLVNSHQEPGQVVLGYGKSWPSATLRPGPAINVRYVCGFGTPSQVPAIYKQGILLIVGHFFENREEVSPANVRLQQMPLAARVLLTIDRGMF